MGVYILSNLHSATSSLKILGHGKDYMKIQKVHNLIRYCHSQPVPSERSKKAGPSIHVHLSSCSSKDHVRRPEEGVVVVRLKEESEIVHVVLIQP